MFVSQNTREISMTHPLERILRYAYCLLFISWRLRNPSSGNADGTECIFGFYRTRVGCGPASGLTFIKALCRTCPVVGRRTNKKILFGNLVEFHFLAQFPVDHLPYSIVSGLIFLFFFFCARFPYLINRFVSIPT